MEPEEDQVSHMSKLDCQGVRNLPKEMLNQEESGILIFSNPNLIFLIPQ